MSKITDSAFIIFLLFLFLTPLLLAFVFPVASQQPTPAFSIVKTTDTSQYFSPVPDPAGITYHPSIDRLIITDSEIDEMAIFNSDNIFTSHMDGTLNFTSNTIAFSKEPTGISYEPVENLYYFSDDDRDRIFIVNPGPNDFIGDFDDTVTNFSTASQGATDLEGLFVKGQSIFIAGGIDKKIYEFSLQGILLNSYDVSKYGIMDFEGITIHPITGNFFILARTPKEILELDRSGNLLNRIPIFSLNSVAPSDLVFAPSSNPEDNPSSINLYITDRGVDNNADPNENDGKLYEISFPLTNSPSQPPPSLTPTIINRNGDANGDGKVDGIDYVVWLNNFNKEVFGPSKGDFDSNGFVDGIDYVIWLNNFRK